jgi:ribosome-associated protein
MELKKKETRFSELVDEIINGMEEVKAENITIFDLTSIENSVCSYFVICDGNSNTQVNAISNSVEKLVKDKLNEKAWHVEGRDNSEWVLMDYVHTVVHIFQKETREFYDLDSLWGDAKITVI